MSTKFGAYCGKVLKVDLTTRKVEEYPFSDEERELFLGGKIMAAKIIYDNVTEKIEVSDILNGTWVFSTTYKIVFTPEAPGATKGTFEVTHTPKSGDAKSAVYRYEYKTDGLEITYVSGDEFTVKLSITAKFQLKYGAYTMKRPE